MEKQVNISKALVEFHKEISSKVNFDAVNPYFKSKYASLGAVIDVISDAAPSYGLSWLQFPVSDEKGIGVETIILHESGESFSNKIIVPFGEESRKVDRNGEATITTKNVAQEAGIIITYLRRYGLVSAFGLYADEDTDGNGTEQKKAESGSTTNPKASKPAQKIVEKSGSDVSPEKVLTATTEKSEIKAPARPYTTKRLLINLKHFAESAKPASDKERQLLVAALAERLDDDDEVRHAVQYFLFGHSSIAEVEPEMVSAALAWLDPVYDKESKSYAVNKYAAEELELVRAEAA